jgi:hypothetical protein
MLDAIILPVIGVGADWFYLGLHVPGSGLLRDWGRR